jgi:hypothetical protein
VLHGAFFSGMSTGSNKGNMHPHPHPAQTLGLAKKGDAAEFAQWQEETDW